MLAENIKRTSDARSDIMSSLHRLNNYSISDFNRNLSSEYSKHFIFNRNEFSYSSKMALPPSASMNIVPLSMIRISVYL